MQYLLQSLDKVIRLDNIKIKSKNILENITLDNRCDIRG